MQKSRVSSKVLSPGLYVTATPIGNLGDITYRAVDVLKSVDLILCEDTRVSARLLSHYEISTKCLAYHDHNAERVRPQILEQLKNGGAIALISDAGTPLISDPGFKLVREVADLGVKIMSIPGPSSPIAALSIAGLPSDRFLFLGFLPAKTHARRQVLRQVSAINATLVFLETGPRLIKMLRDVVEVLGPRHGAVAREMTKLYEEVKRDSVDRLIEIFGEVERVKGEIVVLIEPPLKKSYAADEIDALILEQLQSTSLKETAAHVAAITGKAKREIYSRALSLSGALKK